MSYSATILKLYAIPRNLKNLMEPKSKVMLKKGKDLIIWRIDKAPLETLAAKNQAINNKAGLLCEAPHSTTMVDCHLKSRELLRSYVHYAYCCSCFVTTHLRLRRVATKCWESHWPFSPKTEYEYCHNCTAKIFIRNASLFNEKGVFLL